MPACAARHGPRLVAGAGMSGRLVLQCADDCGENGTRHATAGDLADDATDIRRRGAVGEQRKQHAKDLSPDTTADGSCDRIPERTEIDILGRAGGDISADSAADDLYDQIDEQSRHSVILPRSGVKCQRYVWRRTPAALDSLGA